jgi:uncharacterized protein
MQFEWDPQKYKKNSRKHGVSFLEAASIFGDDFTITVYDPDPSEREDRYISVGLSISDRLIMVAHAERGDRIRIISARPLTRTERETYEEEIKRRKR